MPEKLHRVSPSQYTPEALLEIEGGKKVLFEGEGGVGLSAWNDDFEDLSTLANYEQAFCKIGSFNIASPLESIVTLAAGGGLQFTSKDEAAYFFILLKAFQDENGFGRAIDYVQIIEWVFQANHTDYVGLINRVTFKGESIDAIASAVNGLKESTLNDVENISFSGVTKGQSSLNNISFPPGVPVPVKLWQMTSFVNEQLRGMCFTVNPMESFVTSPIGGIGIGIEQSYTGRITGTPSDCGFFFRSPQPGDIIKKYTAIPLSWR